MQSLNQKASYNDPVSLATTFIMAFYVMLLPILVFSFLRQNKNKLADLQLQQRFGTLYQSLKPQSYLSVHTTVLFFVRRLLFSFSIVFFGVAPLFQACFQVTCSMFMLSYIAYVKPFLEKDVLYFEVFNEATLLTCSYFLIVFCDILMDYQKRYSVGWYMVAVTLFNILANWLNMMIALILQVCKKVLRKLGICKTKKEILQSSQPIFTERYEIKQYVDIKVQSLDNDIALENTIVYPQNPLIQENENNKGTEISPNLCTQKAAKAKSRRKTLKLRKKSIKGKQIFNNNLGGQLVLQTTEQSRLEKNYLNNYLSEKYKQEDQITDYNFINHYYLKKSEKEKISITMRNIEYQDEDSRNIEKYLH